MERMGIADAIRDNPGLLGIVRCTSVTKKNRTFRRKKGALRREYALFGPGSGFCTVLCVA